MSNQFGLFLLIVVISGALCTVEDYVIMSQCAHNRAIHLAAEGTVSVTDISQTQNITIVGLTDFINNDFKIALYAKETQRYLCFNEYWRLVGMKELRDTCYFNETIVHGYFVFRSVADLQRRVGFTRRGKAVGPKKDINNACYQFTKIPAEQFFHQHTDYFAPKSKVKSSLTSPIATTSAAKPTTATKSTQKKSQTRNNNNNGNNFSKNNNNSRGSGMRNNNNNSNNNRNVSNNNQNQQHSNGHSSIIRIHSSNSSNTNYSKTYLSSTKQTLDVENSNNNSNNSRTREHAPHHHHHHHHNHQQQQQEKQQHQVRHHHNDPNLVARRHQHEQKQKRRERNRARTTASPTRATRRTSTTSIASPSTTTNSAPAGTQGIRASATQSAYSWTPAVAAAAASATSRYVPHEISPTNVINKSLSTAPAAVAATTATMSRAMDVRRKGRRRKGSRKQLQQQQQLRHVSANVADATLPTTPDDDVTGFVSEWSSAIPFSSSSSSLSLVYSPTAASTFDSYAQSTAELELISSSSSTAAATETSFTSSDREEWSSPTEPNASSSSDSNTLLPIPTILTAHANSIKFREHIEVAPSSASHLADTTATRILSDAWWSATTSNTLATTLSGTEFTLAPTPMLAVHNSSETTFLAKDIDKEPAAVAYAAITTTDGSSGGWNSSESSNSSAEVLEMAASNDEAFWSDVLDVVDSTNDTSSFNFTENVIADYDYERNASSVLQEYFATPTAAVAAEAFWHNRFESLRTTASEQHNQHEHSKTLITTAASNNLLTTTAAVAVIATTMTARSESSSNIADNSMTDYTYSTRSSINSNYKMHKTNRHRDRSDSNEKQHHQSGQQQRPSRIPTSNTYNKKYDGSSDIRQKPHYSQSKSTAQATTTVAAAATSAKEQPSPTKKTPVTIASSFDALEELFATNEQSPIAEGELKQPLNNPNNNLLSVDKNIDYNHTHNRLSDGSTDNMAPTAAWAADTASGATTTTILTTKNSIRKSMQRLLATPFHQLTYVRNDAGDIDIDNIDNISIYPDLLDADMDDEFANRKYDSNNGNKNSTSDGNNSRLTIVNSYQRPITATAALPESIRIAKIRINNEQRRQRHFRSFA